MAWIFVGTLLLAVLGATFMWLGKNAISRKLDLNLGRFNADNTNTDDWDAMNRASGREVRRGGVIMLALAALSIAATLVIPDGTVGIFCLAASTVGAVAIARAAAKHAVAPPPDWHP